MYRTKIRIKNSVDQLRRATATTVYLDLYKIVHIFRTEFDNFFLYVFGRLTVESLRQQQRMTTLPQNHFFHDSSLFKYEMMKSLLSISEKSYSMCDSHLNCHRHIVHKHIPTHQSMKCHERRTAIRKHKMAFGIDSSILVVSIRIASPCHRLLEINFNAIHHHTHTQYIVCMRLAAMKQMILQQMRGNFF